MIVNVISKGWEVIYQRAHGLLAVQLAHHWKKSERPVRWIETLAAITEHDDGQESLHGRHHITEAGAPKDFMLEHFEIQQAVNITKTSQYKSRWVALLISRHMSFLYERLRGENKTTDHFLDLQAENQKTWKKELNVSEREVVQAYNLLQWCDRCSLILTKNQVPQDEKYLEIHEGPDNRNYRIKQRKDETLSVDPWPFEGHQFEVWIEARELSKLRYQNDEELAKDLQASPVKFKKWEFKK